MPRQCAAPDCKSKTHNKISFFSVPSGERRLKWEKILGKGLKDKDVVCSLHFAESDIIRKRTFRDSEGNILAEGHYKIPRLSKDAVPCSASLYLPEVDTWNFNEPCKNAEPSLSQREVNSWWSDESSEDEVRLLSQPEVQEVPNVQPATLNKTEDFSLLFEKLAKQSEQIMLPSFWYKIIPSDNSKSIHFVNFISQSDLFKGVVVYKQVSLFQDGSVTFNCLGVDVNCVKPEKGDINSLEEVIKKFDGFKVCAGANCTEMYSEDSAKKDVKGTWRHEQCPLILNNNDKRCHLCRTLQ